MNRLQKFTLSAVLTFALSFTLALLLSASGNDSDTQDNEGP